MNIRAILIIVLFICSSCKQSNQSTKSNKGTTPTGTLEVVAELTICPGNIALSKDGRIFLTTHAIRGGSIQLLELLENNKFKPFPNSSYQTDYTNKSVEKLDTPLGIFIDKKDRLWTIDAGFGLGLKGRLFAFDINTVEELYRFDIPKELTPGGSCVQDLAVDELNGWVYISDSGDPAIVALNIASGKFRKFQDSTMLPEDIDMIIYEKKIVSGGKPFKVGMNPISISDDRETIYFGAMSGTKLYSIPAKLFRNQASDSIIAGSITVVGPKPLCDGICTSPGGKHYLSNIQNHSIDVLDAEGNLSTLVKDERIDWPDNVRLGPDGWLYISTNQLYKAPPFTGGDDEAALPYLILRLKVEG